jgi:hypothetical protein
MAQSDQIWPRTFGFGHPWLGIGGGLVILDYLLTRLSLVRLPFFEKHSINADTHIRAHTLTPMNADTHILPL